MTKLTGLIAAVYTPMEEDGRVNLAMVSRAVDFLEASGVQGLYVCGSTGEGMSLGDDERRAVAAAFVKAAGGRLPVVVQVGHNSLAAARGLAAHAAEIGADAISATAPSYYPIRSVDVLVDSMAEIASAAVEIPFYYYHIPVLTGVHLDMVAFLSAAGQRIPTLAGLKYTAPQIHEYQSCLELDGGRFDVLWGTDEMLLSALVVGAGGAVGSTYNIAAPLYLRLMRALAAGDLDAAREEQSRAVRMIRTIGRYPFHPAMKEVLRILGLDVGRCRLPFDRIGAGQAESLRRELEAIGFFEWGLAGAGGSTP